MTDITSSPIEAPRYALHRKDVVGADASYPTIRAAGCNAHRYRFANVQVLPFNGANPAVKVGFWSPKAGQFVDAHTAIAYAGKGADVFYEFTIEANGRIMYVAVTTLTAGSVDIWVAGYGRNPQFE